MILADKITEERKKNGWSQEELAEKLGVSRQAVSKWESAGSVPDLQKVIRLAELFGVSTDYLLKDEMVMEVPASYVKTETREEPVLRVTMEDANTFLDMKKKNAPMIANATFMCIISPALLILLATMAEDQVFHITESMATVAGLVFLFGMIAAAVFMFITYGMRESHMDHLKEEIFETEYGVTGMVKERRNAFEPVFTRGIAVGVVLCILAVVPLLVVGAMDAQDYVCGMFTALLLVLIALGVNIMVRVGMVKGSYDTLLQEGEYSASEKELKRKTNALSGAYWCLVTAIYLGWSFWSMRWDFTWIVWPVAGVLYAALASLVRLVI